MLTTTLTTSQRWSVETSTGVYHRARKIRRSCCGLRCLRSLHVSPRKGHEHHENHNGPSRSDTVGPVSEGHIVHVRDEDIRLSRFTKVKVGAPSVSR